MLQAFLAFIQAHQLAKADDKILLAVSGGIDSVVMLHLFHEAGFHIAVAHANFKLREAEADADAAFVATLSERLGLQFYQREFDTKNYAMQQGLSIQMAARQLRYGWFHELMQADGFDKLATAHHLNDNIETVLMNFLRASSLDGLCGIPMQNGKIIRPLLFANKTSIEAYAQENKLSWREDASNQQDYYQRNFIRLNIVPRLYELYPDLEENFSKNLNYYHLLRQLLQAEVRKFKDSFILQEADILIPKSSIENLETRQLILYESVKHLGFNAAQVQDALDALHHTGAVFYADQHVLNIDREYLIISPRSNQHEQVFIHETDLQVQRGEEQISLQFLSTWPELKGPGTVALMDMDCITFPLTWRSWQAGDRFMPLGMQGMKKISDFLVDAKVPLSHKLRVTVLEDASGKIIWLPGLRIDERCKIGHDTRNAIRLTLSAQSQKQV